VPYTCSHDNLPTVPDEHPYRPVYRELFVMTQFWGQSFFHKMIEVMPRVAPYVDFLRANPGVQIHAPEDRSQVAELCSVSHRHTRARTHTHTHTHTRLTALCPGLPG